MARTEENSLQEIGIESYRGLGGSSGKGNQGQQSPGVAVGSLRLKKEGKSSVSLRNTGGKGEERRRKKVRKASLEIILKSKDGLRSQYEWPELGNFTSEKNAGNETQEGNHTTQKIEEERNVGKFFKEENAFEQNKVKNNKFARNQNEIKQKNNKNQIQKLNIFEENEDDIISDLGIDRKLIGSEDSKGKHIF